MMMHRLGWVLLGAASLACSGRYYDVGSMDAAGGVGGRRGAAGGAAPGGASTAGSGALQAGEGDAGPSTPAGVTDPLCLTASEPPPLTGPFAEPEVVWERVARLTWGAAAPSPSNLPATTSYEWAGGLTLAAIIGAHTTIGDAPGIDAFLRQWLDLDPAAPFAVRWGAWVPVPSKPALGALLMTAGDAQRVGIFSEQSWLAKYDGISKRGESIERALFGFVIPPPPQGVVKSLADSALSDRVALERAVADPACAGCHSLMDPSGFALGHFAADGSYRELDHGETIDSRGSHSGIDFDGIADFGEKFADTCEATLGFSDAFLRAALVINGAPQARQEDLWQQSHVRVQQAFVSGGRSYIALVTAYIQSPAGLMP